MISGNNAHSIAESAKGHYLTGVTGVYVDDNNYMIEAKDASKPPKIAETRT